MEANDGQGSRRFSCRPLLKGPLRLLLDTTVVIYAVEFPDQLSRRAAAVLRNLDNALELSAVSVTEIAIKADSGKLSFSPAILRKAMEDLGIKFCPTGPIMHLKCLGFPAITAIPLTVKSLRKLSAKTSLS